MPTLMVMQSFRVDESHGVQDFVQHSELSDGGGYTVGCELVVRAVHLPRRPTGRVVHLVGGAEFGAPRGAGDEVQIVTAIAGG